MSMISIAGNGKLCANHYIVSLAQFSRNIDTINTNTVCIKYIEGDIEQILSSSKMSILKNLSS